ncbi:hypothetical protein [Amycolatopsis thermoflava]|uniref:Uncharacterized protein n=1 Tax=Amycolatopsis thermoflava TaxID=84480 RepID=A0A3N2H5M9_9PSEU|nr:hypothetical protein [Amycolatopsis thermoflava]ROS43650.1 hypothetical protein EDD35_6070 [Amycolatopsis thermoflava]
MTTSPFEPDPYLGEERIAAADPGPGAPEPAPGFGPRGGNEEDEHRGETADQEREDS